MGLYTLITFVLLCAIAALTYKILKLRRIQKSVSGLFDETAQILESLRDGLIECDKNMLPIRVNKSAQDILGIEASNIVNRAVERGASPTDEVLASVLYGEGETQDVKLGEKKVRVFTITRVEPGSKNVVGYIKVLRDVTLETTIENHKSDLVGIVSHQLMTPLAGIKWLFKSLLGGDAGMLNPKQAELIRKGLIANDGMIELVTDILDVTKVEGAQFAYKKIPVSLLDIVKETALSRHEKAQSRKVTINESLPPNLPQVNLDKERMIIALGNVIDNAIDYSREGGAADVAAKLDGENVEISVSDKGIGISDEAKKRLFEKFYRAENAKRARTSGTGLGLYLANLIIRDHGGRIEVESKENEGSTFKIILPIIK